MRTKSTTLSLFLLLVILTVSAHAKATGPQPEAGDNFRYELGAANLTLFKLFTIQPEKKNPANRTIRTPKAPASKVESDKKEPTILTTPVLDRVRR